MIDCSNFTIFSIVHSPFFILYHCFISNYASSSKTEGVKMLIWSCECSAVSDAVWLQKRTKENAQKPAISIQSVGGFLGLYPHAKSSKWHTSVSFRLHERVCSMMEGLKTYSEVLFLVPSIEITGRTSCWDESPCSSVHRISLFWFCELLNSAVVMTISRSVYKVTFQILVYLFNMLYLKWLLFVIQYNRKLQIIKPPNIHTG